jgi:hypothetical protein
VARTKTPPGWLKVGDHVVSKVPGFGWKGIVVEDRGPLAIDGSQIVMIRVGDDDTGRQFEVGAEDLDRVAA